MEEAETFEILCSKPRSKSGPDFRVCAMLDRQRTSASLDAVRGRTCTSRPKSLLEIGSRVIKKKEEERKKKKKKRKEEEEEGGVGRRRGN